MQLKASYNKKEKSIMCENMWIHKFSFTNLIHQVARKYVMLFVVPFICAP